MWICLTASRARSAQQIMGALARQAAAARGVRADAVFHFAVMPCLDKKLEASRSDFAPVCCPA